MHLKEIWRYPVKSLAGEQLERARVTEIGIEGDRRIVIAQPGGILITARRYPHLLGLKGTTGDDSQPRINGKLWSDPESLDLVRNASLPTAELFAVKGTEGFDILPLSVATDGAIAYLGVDRRRFRPNLLIGGVEGLSERQWEGQALRIGDVIVRMRHLRGRCAMTTWDPDTQAQDPSVLRRIVNELEGTLSLDSEVEHPGVIRIGDPVELVN